MQYLTLLFLTITALAAPLSHKKPSFAAFNTATCEGYSNSDNIEFGSSKVHYHVNIGRPYLGGVLCDLLQAKIKTKFDISGKFSCKGGNDDQNTVLKFKGVWDEKLRMVNVALKAAYPDISFTCPTEIGVLE